MKKYKLIALINNEKLKKQGIITEKTYILNLKFLKSLI